MKDTLLSIAVLGGILVISAVITNLFARKMYNRCAVCGTLNARRRTHCRACNVELK
ncbi:MAG TPA: hypothetical protein VF779_17740 [Pyrinomonadaceae bacterium]